VPKGGPVWPGFARGPCLLHRKPFGVASQVDVYVVRSHSILSIFLQKKREKLPPRLTAQAWSPVERGVSCEMNFGAGAMRPLEKIVTGAAGQIDDLLSKCSERAFSLGFHHFFLLSAKRTRRSWWGEGDRVGRVWVCGTPSRIGGDACSVGTPLKCQAR
jgi:hypothetical protein